MFGLTAIECFVVFVIGFAVLYWIIPKKLSWLSFLALVIAFAWLAFNFTPNENDDITRYFMQIDYLREYGYDYLQKCFDEGINDWDVYRVCGYYFYFISKLPDNFYLPAITIFIVYSLNFLMIYKASVRFNVNKANTFFASIFFIATYWYYDLLGGIRNGLVFAVIFACAYYQFVEKKRILFCILGYILACLTHSAGIIIVVLIAVAAVTLNNSGKFMNFLLIFGIAGGSAGIQFLATKTDNSFVQSIAGKAEDHISHSEITFYLQFTVNLIVLLVVCFIAFYFSYYILNGEYAKDLKMFYKFSLIVLYFSVGAVFNELIFYRLVRWIIPIIGALFFMLGAQIQQNHSDYSQRELYAYPVNILIRERTKNIVYVLFVLFSLVHFWYLCNGTSLTWLKF